MDASLVSVQAGSLSTKTWLISPTLDTTASLCLQFWLAGTGGAGSSLAVKRQYSNGTMGELWRLRGAELGAGQGAGSWIPVQVLLPGIQSQSALVLEGNADTGGWAVDDIRLVAVAAGGECENRPAGGTAAVRSAGTGIFSFVGKAPRTDSAVWEK